MATKQKTDGPGTMQRRDLLRLALATGAVAANA
jgi:hypothetical protein